MLWESMNITLLSVVRSNDWIARRTVEETQKKKYDRVYVQLTVPVRSELYTLRSGPMRLPNYRLPNSEHYLKFYNY